MDNITAYIPANGSLQKIFLCATTAQVVATASFNVGVPAYGKVQVIKTGEGSTVLADVKFGVYSDSDCKNKIAELTTGEDGTGTSGDIPIGTVYLKELSTVNPYIISAEVKSATITANAVTKVPFTNVAAKGKIRIEKVGDVLTSSKSEETEYGNVTVPAYTQKGLKGVVYEVRDSVGKVVATLSTNDSGIAETELLPLGSYTVQEKSAPAAYVVDETIHEVTLAYKDQNTPVVTVTVKEDNELRTGGIKIRKLTQDFDPEKLNFYNKLAEGYVFGLYTAENLGDIPADVLVEVLTTDNQGIAESKAKFPYGNYYLKELSVPDETIEMLTNKLSLTIDSEINVQHYDSPIYNTMFKAKIGVYKLDEANRERELAGAVFEVRDASGKLFDTIATNEDGYAETIDMPVGVYKVKEVAPPVGFILSDEIKTVTLTTEDKETAVFERTNKANEVVLTKTDFTTEKPVPGATVEIYDNEGKLFYEGVTDENGKITVKELPAGAYTFRETISPDGYAVNANTFSFEMDTYGKVTGTTAFTDEPITLTVKKMDSFMGKPMVDISFTLKDSEGNTVKTRMTDQGYRIATEDGEETFQVDDNGYAEFRYLKAGKYTLVETVPTGYIAEESVSFELTSTHSSSEPLDLTVNNCPTGVKIIKLDAATNRPLSGAGFRIKVKDGTGFVTLSFTKQEDGKYFFDGNGKETDLMVDKNGEVVILGLPMGAVWIEESVVPKGYFPVTARKAEITKETSALSPMVIKVPNSKSVKLGLDNDWWEIPAMIAGAVLLLSGAAFFVIKRRKRVRNRRSKQ